MKCPRCENTQLLMSDRQGVEIDYCPQCRGVWLDRGELDKIIERTSTELSYGQAERKDNYKESHHGKSHDNHEGHYRKKSLLRELFD